MKRQPYLSYKDSGIEWLGEVPESWQIMRAKYCAKINMGQSPRSDDCNLNGIGLPFLQGNAEFGPLYPIPKQYCEKARKIARKGDFLISVRAPVGALNIADQDYGIGRGLCGITIGNSLLLSSFCWYLLNHVRIQLNFHATGSTYDAVSADDVGNILMLIPPPSEQLAIATYLDRKTANIDVLIATKEQQTKYLQEKHDALINHAVTKGLNPNAPMKDSEINWLEKIPVHWRLCPLRYLVASSQDAIKTGPFGSQLRNSEMLNGTIKVYNQRNVIDNDFQEGENYITEQKYVELKSFTIYPRDVLITTRGTIGHSAVFPNNAELGILHPCLMRAQIDSSKILPEYLALLIQKGNIVQLQLALSSNATTIDVIYSNNLKQVKIPLPPISEQHNILGYLGRVSGYVKRLSMKNQESIEKLLEYREAVIFAAVTGKIDVERSFPNADRL